MKYSDIFFKQFNKGMNKYEIEALYYLASSGELSEFDFLDDEEYEDLEEEVYESEEFIAGIELVEEDSSGSGGSYLECDAVVKVENRFFKFNFRAYGKDLDENMEFKNIREVFPKEVTIIEYVEKV